MLFHNRPTHFLIKPLVTFNKMTMDYTDEMKFLGIQITDTLKWHSHIQLLASKLSKVAFMLNISQGDFESEFDSKHLF